MYIDRERLHQIIYGERGWGRFTQDSPVMPDVWFGYGADPAEPLDLLIEPYRGITPGDLAETLRTRTPSLSPGAKPRLAYEEAYVAMRVTLGDLIAIVLPLTAWWAKYTGALSGLAVRAIEAVLREDAKLVSPFDAQARATGVTDHGQWFLRLAGTVLWAGAQKGRARVGRLPTNRAIARAIAPVLARVKQSPRDGALLWSINRNRAASTAVWDSRRAIKADAAEQIFGLTTRHLAWAVLDTGIDATHPAFRERDASGRLCDLDDDFSHRTRVRATYDFTRVRALLDGDDEPVIEGLGGAAELRRRLQSGRTIDWDLLRPALEVPHRDGAYKVPVHPHGTHVAGILGADWRRSDDGYDADDQNDIRGICRDIGLYDLRVFDDEGRGDEFTILAALQFLRFLNARSAQQLVHGANLSLSIEHDVSNYACGRTPVCVEAERLHASGVVVVTAAGNRGFAQYVTPSGGEENAYRNISITDPGNAPSVITVGATHRRHPHRYGVSYFSSRGPTGDGRIKPDIVAPGEKIKAPAPSMRYEHFDGTSMAAPHVSGAAALIMSRHPEFIGDPARIKDILCRSATDLGRERYFQGAGLVDVLRAIQSV
ncbi:MAG: S8 family peptidase [Acidobacteria bacterium]|nr:S8 family peptidase [Acidobacteriota bacterium]